MREAIFLRRLNRFLVSVQVDGCLEEAHLPNSGRLRELLVPGVPALVRDSWDPGRNRKTKYTMWGVHTGTTWVCVDAQHANDLFLRALQQGLLAELKGIVAVKREVLYGMNRVDFLFDTGEERCPVEIKSVTLVRDGVALFPDAPTERGRQHFEVLIRAAAKGQRAGIGFMVQRSDATSFSPNTLTDPGFAATLWEAVRKGVWMAACKFEIGQGWIGRAERISVML